jgi:hypothetical protein
MLNRDAVSQALSELREHVRSRNRSQVRTHASLLMGQLDLLIRPIRGSAKTGTRSAQPPVIPAQQQGLSVANIRYVRALISEAVVLSGSDQWEPAKNIIQRAVDRWNEEAAGQ